MLREIVRASLIFVMLVAPMCASVLTFQISDATNNQSINQNYGDNISAFSVGTFTYGSAGGLTPNVTVSYGPATRGIGSTVDCGSPYPPADNTGCVYWWSGDFGDLTTPVIAQLGRGATYDGKILVTLVADPGYWVSLSSLDLAGYYTTSMDPINGVTVTDGSDVLLNSQLGITVPARGVGHASLSFTGIYASTLKITMDASNLANFQGENVGLSNLQFSQLAVPEPSTWFSLASGLGLLALGARRRNRNR